MYIHSENVQTPSNKRPPIQSPISRRIEIKISGKTKKANMYKEIKTTTFVYEVKWI